MTAQTLDAEHATRLRIITTIMANREALAASEARIAALPDALARIHDDYAKTVAEVNASVVKFNAKQKREVSALRAHAPAINAATEKRKRGVFIEVKRGALDGALREYSAAATAINARSEEYAEAVRLSREGHAALYAHALAVHERQAAELEAERKGLYAAWLQGPVR